jgi:HD-GYP domain-containing protein (c-di-GMP phosphodiesterase class II)
LKILPMLRVPLDKIEAGMVLARPIPAPHDPYRFLVQRDHEITLDLIPRLKRLGVLEVWVRRPHLEFLEDLVDERLGERQREVYWRLRQSLEAIKHDPAANLDIGRFHASISDLFCFLKESNCGDVLLQKLDAFDNYLLSHSTNVCYLSLLLGLQLERYLIDQRSARLPRDAKDLRELGLGCLLHDVGKMKIPPEILNKPGKLTPEEMDVIKLHPVYGYEMVKGRVSSNVGQVVLNHHQRYDGAGYPQRIDQATGEKLPPLSGRRIPIFCRIAAVCDVYDAATTYRSYHPPKLPVQVLHEMRTICRGMFDPVVEQAFYEIIPPFPLGQVVKLSTGMEAVVVGFNPRRPVSPKVQGLTLPSGEPVANPSWEEIDLGLYPEVDIVEVDGVDVRPFLASQRASAAPAGAVAV